MLTIHEPHTGIEHQLHLSKKIRTAGGQQMREMDTHQTLFSLTNTSLVSDCCRII
jgi:hypothetical protein